MKSDFVCSICSNVLKKPITFLCGCTVCGIHIHNKDVLKINTFKCKACNIEYNVKELESLQPNKALENLLSRGIHLTEEEKTLKSQIEKEIAELYKLCDQLREKNSLLEVNVYDHFVALRRKIDIRREEVKSNIDDICMKMINLTKKTEAQYMEYLKKQANQALVRSKDQMLKVEQEALDDQFRDPKLLIDNVKSLKNKHEENIAKLKMKLKEFDCIKEVVKENDFKSGVVFDEDLFGSLNLVECSFNSKIVSVPQWVNLMKLCEFSLNEKWTLLYRASENGFGAKDFHSKCDGNANTLTIIKANGTSNVFGGFTCAAWDSRGQWRQDGNAFLFSLVNQDNKPIKMKIIEPQFAIYCFSSYGPIFGGGHDILIENNSNTNTSSNSYLGNSYIHPQYLKGTSQAQSFFAGSHFFQVNDIEVYGKN